MQTSAESGSPQVFISYQWGKQPEIQALYRALTSRGYSCWLDILQMGGGDSLYDKIDRGVRGCHVLISCVTHKYSLSANCRREVSLADALRKPIVPLLLEEMSWPPAGPMSLVLTQLLYIDFSRPGGGDGGDQWSGPQFEQLISKVDAHLSLPPAAVAANSDVTTTKDTNEQQQSAVKDGAQPQPNSDPTIEADNSKKLSQQTGGNSSQILKAPQQTAKKSSSCTII